MTASILGGIFGAFVGVYLVSRLVLCNFGRLGDTTIRIGLAPVITLALGLWAFFPANGAIASQWTWLAYVGASAVGLGVDVFARMGRRAAPAA